MLPGNSTAHQNHLQRQQHISKFTLPTYLFNSSFTLSQRSVLFFFFLILFYFSWFYFYFLNILFDWLPIWSENVRISSLPRFLSVSLLFLSIKFVFYECLDSKLSQSVCFEMERIWKLESFLASGYRIYIIWWLDTHWILRIMEKPFFISLAFIVLFRRIWCCLCR